MLFYPLIDQDLALFLQREILSSLKIKKYHAF